VELNKKKENRQEGALLKIIGKRDRGEKNSSVRGFPFTSVRPRRGKIWEGGGKAAQTYEKEDYLIKRKILTKRLLIRGESRWKGPTALRNCLKPRINRVGTGGEGGGSNPLFDKEKGGGGHKGGRSAGSPQANWGNTHRFGGQPVGQKVGCLPEGERGAAQFNTRKTAGPG